MEQYSSNNMKQLSMSNINNASSSCKLSTPTSGRLSWSKHDLTLPNLIPPNAWSNTTTTNNTRDPAQHLQQLQQSTASPPSSSSSSSCLHLRRTSSSCSNSNGIHAAAPLTNAISTTSGDPRPRLNLDTMNIDRAVQAADPDHGDAAGTAGDPDDDHDRHDHLGPNSGSVIDLGNMINADRDNDLRIYNSAFNSMIDIMSVDPTNDIADGETNDGGSEDANNIVNDLNEEENDHVNDPLDDICNMLALPSPKNAMQISIPGIMGTTSSCCSTANSSSVMTTVLDHNNIGAVTSATMVQALSFQQIETLMLGGEQANHHDTQFSNLLMDLNLC
jgi:hypothetical protein